MTDGYVQMLLETGFHVSAPRLWPLEWINFRMHPCPSWGGVDFYREKIRRKKQIEPVVLCEKCYVILDGWHRVAAHWLEGQMMVNVVFTNKHWMDGKDYCRMDLTNWIQTLKPYTELSCVSGAYHRSDWDNPYFMAQRNLLLDAGDVVPLMRLWEHVRATIFLGNIKGKKILDIGTRESIIPQFLAKQGADVTALDLSADFISHTDGIKVETGNAEWLKYPNESFDIVLCTATIKHIQQDTKAMMEMARVTKNILCVTFDYGPHYFPLTNHYSGRTIYDKRTVMEQLVKPCRLRLVGPTDFDRSDWTDYPIQSQAPKVYESLLADGLNLQVGFLLLKREKRGRPKK